MPKIVYVTQRFNRGSQKLIAAAQVILDEYFKQGYVLTLRQLYYQFVARDYINNSLKEYKRLGYVINNARLAGLIDWYSIEDRTRNIIELGHRESPAEMIKDASLAYNVDMWANQDIRPEVWIEKDALAGVFELVCQEFDVPLFSCRGYNSQSEMWRGSVRQHKHVSNAQVPLILHFGDHDPSGIDMSRDIRARLKLFGVTPVFKRLALNMPQVKHYKPPPNPAKEKDARFDEYYRVHGGKCWELDALEPKELTELLRRSIAKQIEQKQWQKDLARQEKDRKLLAKISVHYPALVKHLRTLKTPKAPKKAKEK